MWFFFSPEVVPHVFRHHSIHISIPCIIIIAERNQFFTYSDNADTGCYKITRYTYSLPPRAWVSPVKPATELFCVTLGNQTEDIRRTKQVYALTVEKMSPPFQNFTKFQFSIRFPDFWLRFFYTLYILLPVMWKTNYLPFVFYEYNHDSKLR